MINIFTTTNHYVLYYDQRFLTCNHLLHGGQITGMHPAIFEFRSKAAAPTAFITE